MKKLILILTASLFIVGNLHAQDNKGSDMRSRFHIGAKAGMNISNMYDSKNEQYDADAKVGFVVGVRAGWDLTNNNGNGNSETPRYKNAWAGLTVGVRL